VAEGPYVTGPTCDTNSNLLYGRQDVLIPGGKTVFGEEKSLVADIPTVEIPVRLLQGVGQFPDIVLDDRQVLLVPCSQ